MKRKQKRLRSSRDVQYIIPSKNADKREHMMLRVKEQKRIGITKARQLIDKITKYVQLAS